MKFIKTAFIVLSVFFISACQVDTATTIASKKNAVVAILAQKNTQPQEEDKSALGTGWFLKDNYIVTNYHVAGDSKSIKIMPEDSETPYEAEYVYGDELSDIAVIRIKEWEDFKTKYNPKYLKLVNRDDIHVAEDVYAIGHPWGLTWSVSKGILSNISRRENPSPNYMLQTDAHVFNGNSGGPLLNTNGDVLGMNDQMIVNNGGSYGMSIAAPVIKKVLNDLEKYKEVRWSAIGVLLEENCVIKSLSEDKPAIKSGLKVGDKIVQVKFDDRIVDIKTPSQLITEIGLSDIDKEFNLTVKRDDSYVTFKIKPYYLLSDKYK